MATASIRTAISRASRQACRALARKGLVGSFLNVRGAARVNAIQRAAVDGSRLKIPLLLGFDVIHGYRTVFPIPLGETASWDPASAERAAAIAPTESAAVGLKWTFAPMVDTHAIRAGAASPRAQVRTRISGWRSDAPASAGSRVPTWRARIA